MRRYKFEVTFEDDTVKLASVDQRDIRRWESEKSLSWLANDLTVTATTEIAFYGLKRAGEFPGTWEDFDASVVWIREIDDDDDAVGPTRKAATGARSSRSRSVPASA